MHSRRALAPGSLGYTILAGSLAAQAALAVDSLVPSLPSIVSELGMSPGSVQLTVAVFMGGFALGQIPWGWLSDWLGRRTIMLVGTGGFIAAGAMCALAENGSTLIAWRLVQGFFASAGMAATRAMLRDNFQGVRLARQTAAMTTVFFLSPILAPQVGTLLLHFFGWRASFLVPGLIGLASFLVVWRVLKESHPPNRRRRTSLIDIGKALLAILRHPLSSLCLGIQATMAIGLITWISTSPLILTQYFGVPLRYFGIFFAASASVQLSGSLLCNQLLKIRGSHEVMALGAGCCVIGGGILFTVTVLTAGSLWSMMAGVWIFMLGFGLIVPSSGGMALHAFGAIGGLAAALVGTMQSLTGSLGSMASAALFDGTPRSLGIGVGVSAALAAIVAGTLSYRLRTRPELLDHIEELSIQEEVA
jgi:DHA1 family bicyclomycin/chloramphenicol resistance-like MFS transporter